MLPPLAKATLFASGLTYMAKKKKKDTLEASVSLDDHVSESANGGVFFTNGDKF